MERQVISRQRVVDHGEVLTGVREVNAMLDLVKEATERVDSRFLEPACGTGNYLIEILRRKLRVVERRYRRSQLEWERNAVLAVSSVYGIDILEDSVIECRRRLFAVFDENYARLFKKKSREQCRRSVQFILELNIIRGDALTLKTKGSNPKPIVFSEWSFAYDSKIKRRDFQYSELLAPTSGGKRASDLFSQGEEISELGEKLFFPEEIRSYAPVHFLKLGGMND